MACGGGSSGGTSGGGTLTLTATPSMVVANGTNAVLVHVAGSQKGPVVVRTDRGHFLESGGLTASNPTTAPFDVTLVTCDSQVVTTGCVGNALVSVSDQNLASNQIQVRFVGIEICTNHVDDDSNGLVDCADPACAGQACGVNGLACSAASPSACECPSGQAHELPAQCQAAVPLDNDCDGKAGCADSDCLGQVCATGTLVNGNPLFGSCKTGGVCTCVSTQGTKETSCGDGDRQRLRRPHRLRRSRTASRWATRSAAVCDTLGHTCSPKAMTGGTIDLRRGLLRQRRHGAARSRPTASTARTTTATGWPTARIPNCADNGLACKVAPADPLAGKICERHQLLVRLRRPGGVHRRADLR